MKTSDDFILTWRQTSPHIQFTVTGLTHVAHCPRPDAQRAIAQALNQGILQALYVWVCPRCSGTLGRGKSPEPPHGWEYCEWCDADLSRWTPHDWAESVTVYYGFP